MPNLPAADSPVACKEAVHLDLFQQIIDMTYQWRWSRKGHKTRHLLAYEQAAKDVCSGCPVVIKCLERHGSDPGVLGVVGGMNDSERLSVFGGAA